MENRMNDYRAIEMHIRNARLERSRVIGELIAGAIFAIWTGMKQLAKRASAVLNDLVKTPDEYSTAMPRHF